MGGAAKSKGKGGMTFGQGVYESALNSKLDTLLNESMNMNMSMDSEGQHSLTVTATDEDAMQLAQILKMAGLGGQSDGYKEACPGCGQAPCGCGDAHDEIDEALANAPDEVYADTDTMVNKLSGGLNGPKTTGQSTIPVLNRDPARQTSHTNEFSGQVVENAESRLWELYQRYDRK